MEELSPCIEWTGWLERNGYGKTKFEGRSEWAHRVAWIKANGQPIPKGMVVRHKCDNPPCVNPDHLELGTQRDNMADALERNRTARGSALPHTVHTEEQVRRIILAVHAGESIGSVAERFGEQISAVSQIANGTTWKYIHEELGIPPRVPRRRPRMTEAERETMRRLKADGLSIVQIAARTGRTWNAVSNALKRRPAA